MHLSFGAVVGVGWLLWCGGLKTAAEGDNEIVGPLNVTCQGGSALINFKTKTAFAGRVYVKGAYAKPQCNRDFSYASNNESALEMPLGDCGGERDKVAGSERAFKYVSIVVISFHPKFITKDDRAYRVECLYRTGDTEVSNELNISDLTTESYAFQPPAPICKYTLHVGNVSGPEAKYVRVGDALFHKWNCDSGHYAIFVHSCFAVGPGQEQVQLLDENGCALDGQIMPNLTYAKSMNESWVETRAFRYQDAEAMRFNCKIKTCLKADTGCIEAFPRKCLSMSGRRSRTIRSTGARTRFRDQLLYSPAVKLVDPFGEVVEDHSAKEESIDPVLPPASTSICFAQSALAVLIAATCLLLLFVLISLSLLFKRRK